MDASLYDVHMERWLQVFPRDRIMIIKNEDLRTPAVGEILRQTEDFLGANHELKVTAVSNRVIIRNLVDETKKAYSIDTTGRCKYEDYEKYAPYLQKFRSFLKPHVARFEKMVDRKFHWF